MKAILWDIDGTLLDFLQAEAYGIRKCFSIFGLDECTDEMLERYSAINRCWWQRLERGEYTKPEILEGRFRDFFAEEGIAFDKIDEFNLAYQYHLGDHAFFFKNGLETLKELQGTFAQYAVTNGTARAQDRKLIKSGLDQIFEGVFISERVGYEKPDIRFFDAVFAAIPYAKEECILIGDSLTSDMKGGMNAGIRTIWYNPQNLELPPEYSVDHIISDLAQVPAIIMK